MCTVPEYFGPPVLCQQESMLYRPLDDYLHQGFAGSLQPPSGWCRIFTSQIAQVAAPDGGMWSRPDVAAVILRRRKYATTVELDTLSFEVKTHKGADLKGVHEALAHARFMNQSFFVWNRPACTCSDEQTYAAIIDNCRAYGVGLITIHNPNDLRTFVVRLQAAQNQIPGDTIDRFIESRFPDATKTALLKSLREFMRELP